MANKIFKALIAIPILVLPLIANFPAWGSELKRAGKIDENRIKELVKKHRADKAAEELLFNDIFNDERHAGSTDLDNDSFLVTYPKCFTAEPTIEDADNVTVKNSGHITLRLKKKCESLQADKMFREITIERRNRPGYVDFVAEPRWSPNNYTIFKKIIKTTHSSAKLFINLDSNEELNGLSLKSVTIFSCKGKNSESFLISSWFAEGKRVEQMLATKKFDLPEDLKRVIASFRCRKDR